MNKIFIALLLALYGLNSAQAQDLLIYRCSDSLYQSQMSINTNGEVTITESCANACHFYEHKLILTESDRQILTQAIYEARSGYINVFTVDRDKINCSGELTVFSENKAITINKAYGDIYAPRVTVEVNDSPASRAIRDWVMKRVKINIVPF